MSQSLQKKKVLNRPKRTHWRLGLDNSHVWILEGLEQALSVSAVLNLGSDKSGL